jgi:hypothetical protein
MPDLNKHGQGKEEMEEFLRILELLVKGLDNPHQLTLAFALA